MKNLFFIFLWQSSYPSINIFDIFLCITEGQFESRYSFCRRGQGHFIHTFGMFFNNISSSFLSHSGLCHQCNANIGEVWSWGGSDTDDASVGPVLTGGDVDKEEIKETWKMLQLKNYCLDVHWDVHWNCECTDIFHSMLKNLHVMIRLTSNQKTFQWLNLLQLSSQDILAK